MHPIHAVQQKEKKTNHTIPSISQVKSTLSGGESDLSLLKVNKQINKPQLLI